MRLAIATLKVLEATSHSCGKQVRLKRLTHTWRIEGSQIYTLRQAGKGNRFVTGGRVIVYGYVHGVWPAFTFSKSGSVSLSGSKSTVAPTQWPAATSVMMAAIPIPILMAMVPQWDPETHDLRPPLSRPSLSAAPAPLGATKCHWSHQPRSEVVDETTPVAFTLPSKDPL